MKVAILSINIGEYICFWKEFYETVEKNFLPEYEKEYFVFTDEDSIEYEKSNRVNKIYQEDMGWPFNTMKRFHLFCGISDRLEGYDYVFFANANARFVRKLTREFIIDNKDIIAVAHPGVYGDDVRTIPWERRPESRAYVSYEEGKTYVQGAFYGGKSKAFLSMIRELDDLTEADISDNIIAIGHDESFLNKYIVGKSNSVQILGRQYLKYEELTYPFVPVIELRDKTKYISMKNDRFKGREATFYSPFLVFLREVKWKFLIKIGYYKWVDYKDTNGNYIDLDVNV